MCLKNKTPRIKKASVWPNKLDFKVPDYFNKSKNKFSTPFPVMHPDETLCSSINKWAVLDQNKLQSQPDCVSVRLERSMNREES